MRIEFKYTDFEVETVKEGVSYARLILSEGELCIEPLLFNRVFIASYDHEQNLIGDKINCSQLDLFAIGHAIDLKLKEFNEDYSFLVLE